MTIPGIPYQNPLKYTGPDLNVVPIIPFPRPPTVTDTKYRVGTMALIMRDPISGVQGSLYYLAKFNSSGQAIWELISTGVSPIGPIETITVDAHTSPGTDPVEPDASASVIFTGGQVAAGTTTNVIRTDSLAASTVTIEIQRSTATASTTIGSNGVSHYDSVDFTVDSNGWVQNNASLPSFYAGVSTTPTNVTGDGTSYTILFDAIQFNTGSYYDASTGIFTAPYAGVYLLTAAVAMTDLDAAMTRGFATIVMDGADDFVIFDLDIGGARNVAGTFCASGSVIVSLAATNTAKVIVQIDNSTKTADINQNCKFSGSLIRRT